MTSINHLLSLLDYALGSYPFLFLVFVSFFILKTYILIILATKNTNNLKVSQSNFFLMCVILSSMVGDSAWILKLVRTLFFPSIDFRFYILFLRIAWGFSIVQYQALSFFIESLVEQHFVFKKRHIFFLAISGAFSLFFIILAITHFNCYHPAERPALEFLMQKIETLYVLFPVIMPSLFIVIQKLRSSDLPILLNKQLKIFIVAVIIPYWISDFFQIYPFSFSPTWITNSYTLVSLSNILLIYAVFYCIRKITYLRFLNFKTHVQSSDKITFIDHFRTTLEQLGHVKTLEEIGHITQTFFKEQFNIPVTSSFLYVRKRGIDYEYTLENNQTINAIEKILIQQKNELLPLLAQTKILIYDELTFSNFYEETAENGQAITFLHNSNADIFLPIYQNNHLIAYIVINRQARPNQFYSNVERDEMIVYVSYLGNIINLLQTRNLDAMIEQEKRLQEELHQKQQEITHYKESMYSLLRSYIQNPIGVIFYKNEQITFGNSYAKELVKLANGQLETNALAKTVKYLGQQIAEYKMSKTVHTQDLHGTQLTLTGLFHHETEYTIILIHNQETFDRIKHTIDMLKDPTEWDYLTYLETTESGSIINKLIPGSGKIIVSFKIQLLKAALSKNALLIDVPDDDILSTVELLNSIGARSPLHVLTLHNAMPQLEVAIKLFGINSIFGMQEQIPLLKSLHPNGTLLIKNIHFLDKDTQKQLADYLHYGLYSITKSEQKEASSVRIICATNKDLQTLVHQGSFDQHLFNELMPKKITLPSLLTLAETELNGLFDGFIYQSLKRKSDNSKILVNDQDKNKIAINRPASLHELKNKAENLIIQKSKEQIPVYHETKFDDRYTMQDPDLIQAARLGKHALKDRKIMTMLWQKFKNQNKIASFLSVNRSSVNRRCKEYKLL